MLWVYFYQMPAEKAHPLTLKRNRDALFIRCAQKRKTCFEDAAQSQHLTQVLMGPVKETRLLCLEQQVYLTRFNLLETVTKSILLQIFILILVEGLNV